ncbi:hypothetical protein [Oligoflexus tunisiensis]|uniref:hypothetical protein n=1 Tax=Oligoflexus tunisiensis TaxID=708132 RepID=UPI001C403A49|nr:hypothetical protein [Oligoflexus tunisiensis]
MSKRLAKGRGCLEYRWAEAAGRDPAAESVDQEQVQPAAVMSWIWNGSPAGLRAL